MLLTSMMSMGVHAQVYNVLITGDFESSCVLSGENSSVIDELYQALVACEGSKVSYTAHVNTSGQNIIDWWWDVEGGTITGAANSSAVTVAWGVAGQGLLSVTVTTDSGIVYTHSQPVNIVEAPVVGAITTPNYGYSHDINVCRGMSVYFMDDSHASNTDIVGYYWEGCDTSATSRNFTLGRVTSNCTITHRVYNSCGCYDEEFFYIYVNKGDPLVISCYGTACGGSTVRYHATSPVCSDYHWVIEGGALADGQGSPDFTVVWDSMQTGYGIINLAGSICGDNSCPGYLSVKIPVIQDSVNIEGQLKVCEGDAVVYSVPLFGSTEYTWNISNSNGVEEICYNNANKITYKFNQAGTYYIYVEYSCSFLNCGPRRSRQIEVNVKPRLEIEGEYEVCIANNATYTIDGNTYCTWTVYELPSNIPVYTSPQDELRFETLGNILSPGKYRLTASNPNYCNEAEFVFYVRDTPPEPDVPDLDPDNPTVSCPHSGIRLQGHLANPEYNLVWRTVCEPNSTASGDDVTLLYDDEVCDVEVYTYDRRLRCQSRDAYVHHVVPFVLLPTHLPQTVREVCPNGRISYNNDTVPYQDGVIYEWELETHKEYCATIEGSKHTNTIELHINDFSQPISPTTFNLYLYRTYCSGIIDTDTVIFRIVDYSNTSLTITGPTDVCQWAATVLEGSGCSGPYTWKIDGDTHTYRENPMNCIFNYIGNTGVIMYCNPYYGKCDNKYLPKAITSIHVSPNPAVAGIVYDGTNVYTVPPLSNNDYSFRWYHDTNVNNDTVHGITNQSNYTCTITSNATGCTTTVSTNPNYGGGYGTPCGPLTVVQRGTLDYCSKTISFKVLNPPASITWNVSGTGCGPLSYSGDYNDTVIIPVTKVGHYVATAAIAGQPCYRGYAEFTVDFIPDFRFEDSCDRIIITNNSRYLDNTKTMQLSANGTPIGTYPVDKDTVQYNTGSGGTFNFRLTSYDGHTLNCNLGTEEITNTAGANLTITTANTADYNSTCDNTPLRLNVATNPPGIISSVHWDFDDNYTSLDTTIAYIYHTFEKRSTGYNVSVTVIDTNGCKSNGSIQITSHANSLKKPELRIESNIYPVCLGSPIDIKYMASGNEPLFTTYYWVEDNYTSQSNIHTVYNTADYHVDVTNNHYCETHASVNVAFYSLPPALIISKKYKYCVGEAIELYGIPDDMNNYQYQWTIQRDGSVIPGNYNSGTVTLPASNTGCQYTIDLTVRDDNTGCTNSAPQLVLKVFDLPPKPAISIATPHCIHESPVHLVSNTDETHWSNGDVGLDAYYSYPGVATAWYYDNTSGCRSDTAALRISEAPDFDALLTGCYIMCEDSAYRKLPVYGLLPCWQKFGWEWFHNSYTLDNGTSGNGQTVLLPLKGMGNYNLNVNYYDDCGQESRYLVIEEDKACKCDLEITSEVYVGYDKDCNLTYNIEVTVCNNSVNPCCLKYLVPQFDALTGNITMTSNTFSPVTLNQYGCTTFYISLIATQLMPTTVVFRLIDEDCAKCVTDFSVDLTPDVNCFENKVTVAVPIENTSLSGNGIIYYDFNISVSGASNVLAVWSNPETVLNFGFNAITPSVYGLCAFDCRHSVVGIFDIYVLVCTANGLCVWRYNMDTGLLPPTPRGKSKGGALQETTTVDDTPLLKPNPATGMVGVESNDAVTEVLVMDMNERQMATFSNTTSFNVANLATGTYIVRIKSIHGADATERITYLKLVKQ